MFFLFRFRTLITQRFEGCLKCLTSRWNAVPESCAYALALDGSERSEKLLAQWPKSSKSEDSRYYLDAIASSIRDHAAQKTFAARPSRSLMPWLPMPFSSNPLIELCTKAHLLALSSAGNKALVRFTSTMASPQSVGITSWLLSKPAVATLLGPSAEARIDAVFVRLFS